MAFTTEDRQEIIKIYIAGFDRAPDSSGLAFWSGKMISGELPTINDIANAIFGDQSITEVAANYPAYMTNEEFLTAVYQNVFNRAPDAEGLAFWAGHMDNGLSRGEIVVAMFESLDNAGSEDDKALFDNKVAVSEYVAVDLGSDDLTLASTVLNGVTTDAASVDTAKAFADDQSNYVDGSDFNLTEFQDTGATFTGGAGDDTFYATDDTLSSSDDLDGGAGNDTLNYSATASANHAAFDIQDIENLQITTDAGATVTMDLSGDNNEGVIGNAGDLRNITVENSSGNADLNFINVAPTTDFTLEVNDLTGNGDVSVDFIDSRVAGTSDVLNVELNNSFDANVGTLDVEDDSAASIETVNVTTSGAASSINTALNTDASTLNILGDQNLSINAITGDNSGVPTIDASGLNANFTVTTAMTNVTSYTGAQGADTVDFTGAAADMTISAGTGNDTVITGNGRDDNVNMGAGDDNLTLGTGDDTVDLGEGDDSMNMLASDLTIADVITGGAGNDTLTLNDADRITASEAEQVTDVETWTMTTAGTHLEITTNMIESITGDAGRLTINHGVAGNTTDMTNVVFSQTGLVTINGTTGSDTVIADDDTVNAKATLAFDQDSATDTLRIIDGATVTADDQVNITGLDRMELVSDSSEAQTWNIELNAAAIDDANSTAVVPTSDVLTIYVDQDVQAGSVLNLDAANINTKNGQAFVINVLGNANVTVNVTNDTNDRVAVVSSLEFTENTDNLVGTVGDDLFLATSLDQVDTADNANGGAHVAGDTLQLDFGLYNGAAPVATQLNNANITNIEILDINTGNDVSFLDVGIVGFTTVNLQGGGNNTVNNIDVATANFGAGNDTVVAQDTAATANMGEGNNSWASNVAEGGAATVDTVTAGTGTDSVTFADDDDWTAADTLTLGTGTDTVNVTIDTDNLDTSAFNLVSGVDVLGLTFTSTQTFTLDDTMVDQSDAANTITINADDNDNGSTIDGDAVTVGTDTHFLTINLTDSAGATVLGSAGSDIITSTAGGAADVFRGNAGADQITLSTGGVAQIVELATANDGGDQGVSSGYDVVTNFTAGEDTVQFAAGEGIDQLTFDANGALNSAVADLPVDFNATNELLVMTEVSTGMTDTDILDFAQIAANVNVLGVTAAATDAGIVVAQGNSDTAVYLYVEQDGTANSVATTELKLLATFDAQLAAGDFAIA